MALIRDALGKLRAVEADQNSGEGAMRRVYLYRGMKDVAAPPTSWRKVELSYLRTAHTALVVRETSSSR